MEKPHKPSFDITPEEFDSKFRAWLRKQYLPALISKGEPAEYGDPFTANDDVRSQEISPIVAPSGDLMAAVTTYKQDVDIALFNVPDRKLFRNLTKGFEDQYEFIISQSLTTGPVLGRDVAFSPTGDQIAFFVKKERGRNLMIINALSGKIQDSVAMQVEQQLSPTYSPDGKRIAFQAFRGNRADIFIYDLESNSVSNLTSDDFYDGSPTYSPDGRWLVYSSVVDGYSKLFRIDLQNPSRRYQLTTGTFNDIDASFAPDGKRIFYASDRLTGRNEVKAAEQLEAAENIAKPEEQTPPADPANFAAYNIYALSLETGEVHQYTDVIGGCFTPSVFIGAGNKERMIFASFYKRQWRLYSTLTDKPLRVAEKLAIRTEPILAGQRTAFLPAVEVEIDPEKIDKYGGFRLFVDDVQVNAGVNSDQTYVSRSVIFMSDMLGNRRFIAALDSVSTFSNFDFLYLDMTRRTSWGVRLMDDRSYFVTQDRSTGDIERSRRLYRQTGMIGILSYPFDRYHRIDFGGGYMSREISYPRVVFRDGVPIRVFEPRSDNFPIVSTTFTGDSAQFREFGPISGRRYELSASYAPDLDEGGDLSTDLVMDVRKYFPVTARSLVATRVFGGYSNGNFPNFYYFGGLNTLRGYDFRTFVGDRAVFANVELRLPLIELLAPPYFAFDNIRGNLFLDIGGA